MGTAALPTANTPAFLESARDGRAWYQTWSHLTTSTMATAMANDIDNGIDIDDRDQSISRRSTNLIACYADDGRIAVNAELSAGNGVYAAGSVAKYPNPWTGNADTAGVGVHDGRQAGLVAAYNMARDYQQRTGNNKRFALLSGSKTPDISRDSAYLKHPIPIWRSDQMANTSSSSSSSSKKEDLSNALKDAGIHALCVGCCDSDKFSTQAFWWTNQSKRFRQLLGEDDINTNNSSRRTTRRNANSDKKGANNQLLLAEHPLDIKPVYGRGIIFYMDQDAGQIQGIMIWGLPFTDNNNIKTKNNDKGDNCYLNAKLIRDMEEIIQTNGGFANLGLESELERVQFVQYLTAKSRQLVADSIEPFTSGNVRPENLPRPLLRYTEVKPANIRRVRVLNRRHEAQGHGFLGEDLFARCNDSLIEIPPAPLPQFDDLREVSETDSEAEALQSRDTTREERTAMRRSRAQAMQDWAVWEWYQRRWEENEDLARPPKEDPLWLRKGDENRGVSSRERFNESLMKAIFPEGR